MYNLERSKPSTWAVSNGQSNIQYKVIDHLGNATSYALELASDDGWIFMAVY